MKHYQLIVLACLIVFCPIITMGQTKKIESVATGQTQKTEKKSRTIPSAQKRQIHPPKEKNNDAVVKTMIDNMVYVEGGMFTNGHQVLVASFSIGKYEVTQKEWKAVMGRNPSYFKGDKRPVERISWNDCQMFIRELNKKTGKQFRLPTAAEWEYAARGGRFSNNKRYAGSDNPNDVAWHNDNSNNETHEVGKKQANELGLYDMAGNVWEWCSDSEGDNRANCGGSFKSSESSCRISSRSDDRADEKLNTLGFRLAL